VTQTAFSFDPMFSEELLANLTHLNPWWNNKPMPEQPPTRRHLVSQIHRRIEQRRIRDKAFSFFPERGGYPLVHKRGDVPWPNIAEQLNETVIRRVIQHDLRVGEVGRKRDPALLEELFRLVCRYAGQSPSVTLFARETHRALQTGIGTQRIRIYLRFLADTLLIRLVDPLEIALKKKRKRKTLLG